MKRRMVLALAGLAALLLGSKPEVTATTRLKKTLTAQVDTADLIFTGTVLRSEAVLSGDGRFAFTYVTFSGIEALKGRSAEETLTLMLHGGATDRLIAVVDGMPEFQPHETYLVFVRGNEARACPVLGWDQGWLRFELDPATGRPILVDAHGAQVRGLDRENWLLGPAPWQLGSDSEEPPSAGVSDEMDTDGGAPIQSGMEPGEPGSAADAAVVLDELRSLIQARSFEPTYLPGQVVRSADPRNVPSGVTGSGTADQR
jgi:hypothetical protein